MTMFDLFRSLIAGKSSEQLAKEAQLEQESLARRQRNEQRMNKIKAEMGEKYILHPSHMKSRLDEPRPV